MPLQDKHTLLAVPGDTIAPQISHVFIYPFYVDIIDKLSAMFDDHKNLLLFRLLGKALIFSSKTSLFF
jgi:hypothetical protein